MADIFSGPDYWLRLREQIARRTRNPSEAEDLLHSAFVRFRQYQQENDVQDPGAFIVKTACNLAIDNIRRQKKTVDASEAEALEDNLPLQDEVVASRERLRRVQEGIGRLPPQTQQIFTMHRWQELKYQEIADRLGISTSSVEKHMARAMLFLSGWIEGW